MKRIIHVVGARPNFMKVAPLERELAMVPGVEAITVHTGQHYDKEMSDIFFEQLGISRPERDLGVGSGGHGEMTGKIMIEFEKACLDLKPDMVTVVGDVNSTIAAALVARKLFLPVSHVEAGLRSFDETMPEELNRRLTDCLSNLLFVSEPSGIENLQREGIDMSRVHLVGDIMLETLQSFLPAIRERKYRVRFGKERKSYILVTLHRPSNVDTPGALEEVVGILEGMPLPVIFPIHPRTTRRLEEYGLAGRITRIPHLTLTSPLSYLDFLSLLEDAAAIFSDSGSVQSEASFFNVPCLVCRENTERPIYIQEGTSVLVGRDREKIRHYLNLVQRGEFKESSPVVTELGTGVAAKIVDVIARALL
ncbi:MAG: UDP-N-acetylglucosamine 2-epimerase (non-hydrolyzing) [Thermodesulfobacteriota bacterium]